MADHPDQMTSGTPEDDGLGITLDDVRAAFERGELEALRGLEAELHKACPRLPRERIPAWVKRATSMRSWNG
jgi:hypothetical protein